MFTCFWSPKGGVGVSTVTTLFAIAHAAQAQPTLVVDTENDLPAILGIDDPQGPGIRDWVATPDRPSDAIRRIAGQVTPDLAIVHGGDAEWPAPPANAASLATALASQAERVFVDAGRGTAPFVRDLIARSDQRILVVRNDYLSLRSARVLDPMPTGVVMLVERGRALGAGDAEAVTSAPIVAEIAVDIAVARSLDAGLATTRLPRSLLRAVSRVALDV